MRDKYRHAYIINEVHSNKYQLCRILNEYDSDLAVTDDLKELLADKITEKDLLKMFNKQ